MSEERIVVIKSNLNKLTSYVKRQNKPSYLKRELRLGKQVYLCQDSDICYECKFYKQSRGKSGKSYCIAQRLDTLHEELYNLKEARSVYNEAREEFNQLAEDIQNSEVCPGCGYPYDSRECHYCGFVNDYDSEEGYYQSDDNY